MNRHTPILLFIFCCGMSLSAQTMTEGEHIRRGNSFYVDSLYEKAEIEYRKALELNPQSVDAMYNLGNALFYQITQSEEKAEERGEEAMQQYTTAAKLETDKEKLAHIYHNLGTLLYMAQQYPQSVAAYKEAMRNNPHDDETRYNLAKAMHMLQQQQPDQEQNQEQQQDQQQQEQQQQQQEQQQQQDQNQQEQQDAQQSEDNISTENAEQLLNAVMQDEKDIQEKVKQMQQQQGKTLDKDW